MDATGVPGMTRKENAAKVLQVCLHGVGLDPKSDGRLTKYRLASDAARRRTSAMGGHHRARTVSPGAKSASTGRTRGGAVRGGGTELPPLQDVRNALIIPKQAAYKGPGAEAVQP